MHLSRPASLLLLWLLGALGVWAMAAVALLRFDTGAAYPRYSSFRPDPVGTKALHAALSELPGLEVERNFEPIDRMARLARLAPGAGTTLLFAGADADELEAEGAAAWSILRRLAGSGARVVVAFAPAQDTGARRFANQRRDSRAPGDDTEAETGRDWAPRFEHAPLTEDEKGRPRTERAGLVDLTDVAAALASGTGQLPPTIACTTSLWFAGVHNLQPGWRVVYARAERPVAIERRVGAGTLVLIADAFALSNESLRFGRETQFVSWMLGVGGRPAPRTVIFDETHLGTTAPAGTMALARRYRLHWFFATLAVLALLFVWRAASPLVPPAPPPPDAVVAGRDAMAGIAGLLRRGLTRQELMPAAVETWRKSTSPPADLASAAAALARSTEDPVAIYQRIRSLVDENRHARRQRTTSPEDSDAART